LIAVFILQGTAATVLAGLYGALKVQGMPPEELRNRRIMIVGAGSAASGVALTIRYGYRQCCGSGMFIRIQIEIFSIPDPNFYHPESRIRIKEFKYFNPRNCF
jgi:hypothetical protein